MDGVSMLDNKNNTQKKGIQFLFYTPEAIWAKSQEHANTYIWTHYYFNVLSCITLFRYDIHINREEVCSLYWYSMFAFAFSK